MRRRWYSLVTTILMIGSATVAFGMSISEAKLLGNGESVSLPQKVVTYAGTNFFYIEDDSRACGIRAEKTAHGLAAGMRADVDGKIQTNGNGERYIAADSAVHNGDGTLAPLGISSKCLGGGDWHYDKSTGAGQAGVPGGVGLNNIGLLVRTYGHIVDMESVAPPASPSWVTVDDGSGTPVTCYLTDGVGVDSSWQFASITGVSSLGNVGGTASKIVQASDAQALLQTNVTGRWEFIGTHSEPAGVFGMLISQYGSRFLGSFAGFAVNDGVINGNQLTGWLDIGSGQTIEFTANLVGDEIDATINIDGTPVPFVYHKVSDIPISPYTGRPRVLAGRCDQAWHYDFDIEAYKLTGLSFVVKWDRPVHGWDFKIYDAYGASFYGYIWADKSNFEFNPATNEFRITVLPTLYPLLLWNHTYTFVLEDSPDRHSDVDWHDPYGAGAWVTSGDAYSFEFTLVPPQ